MAIKKHNSKKHKTKKHNSKKFKKTLFSSKKKIQRGGNSIGCSLASIKEPGFNIAKLGDIAGLSIPDSRGVIYRPNCGNPNENQAMAP